jgi:hypothetical protein
LHKSQAKTLTGNQKPKPPPPPPPPPPSSYQDADNRFNSGPTIGPGPAAVGNSQDSCRILLATLPQQQCLSNSSLVYHSVFVSLISIFLKLFLLDSEQIPMAM